tara:strand:+ start:199 stop:375 length:177 start_codon:yes stop_codon:yes gene_type:complete
MSEPINKHKKLTEDELLERLDNGFQDVGYVFHDPTTKESTQGIVAVVYFYEDEEKADE